MKHMTARIALFFTALLSLSANAALIQVEYTIVSNGGFGNQIIDSVSVSMIFDTQLPPSPGPNGTLVFTPIATVLTSLSNPNPPGATTGIDLNNPPTVDFARLQYFPNGNTIALEAADGAGIGTLTISQMPSAFHPAMVSLPEDPADWLPDMGTTEYRAQTNLPSALSWSQALGYFGGVITYTVTTLPSPSTACSPADINGDGQLNFFDVSAFLDIFRLGCP